MTIATDTKRELHMMRHPDLWLRWPFLPLVSRSRDRRCGLLMEGHGATVFYGNVWNVPDDPERKVYTSFEELVKDWRVD